MDERSVKGIVKYKEDMNTSEAHTPFAVVIGLILFGISSLALAQQGVPPNYLRAKNTALDIIVQSDSFRAIEYISALGEPEEVMGVFELVTRDLYWEKKDLTAAMAMGRAAIQYGLVTSLQMADGDQKTAFTLRSQAKSIAYDLASFSWPGWDEAGIEISSSDLIFGQDAAKTNLRLAVSLRKGDLPMSRAFWVLGAHHLAVDKLPGARKAFVEGIKYATAAEAKEFELLLRGYVYLVDMLEEPGNRELLVEFDFVKRQLLRSQDGKFYSDQLETAYRVFTKEEEL